METHTHTHFYRSQSWFTRWFTSDVWRPAANENPAAVFVAAVIRSATQRHFTFPLDTKKWMLCPSQQAQCGKQNKISPNFQIVVLRPAAARRLFHFNPRMPFFFFPFSVFFIITKSKMSARSGAEPQKPLPGPERAAAVSFFFFLTFYLMLFNWLAAWRRNSEQRGRARDGAERKVMFLDVEDSCGRAVMKK